MLSTPTSEAELSVPTRTPGHSPRFGPLLAWMLVVVLATAHGVAIWIAMGGTKGLNNGWPLWRHDHPLYFHSALVTREFLKQTGTTAGYDPSFMSGYAKSIIFPSSSTLPELAVALFGRERPEFAYKVYVLISAALIPWLVAAAGRAARLKPGAVACSVLLFLVYVWTDFPINYASFGMLPYLLAVPVALLAATLFCRYLADGGFGWWLGSCVAMIAAVMIHFTTAMVLAPAAGVAYHRGASLGRVRFTPTGGQARWDVGDSRLCARGECLLVAPRDLARVDQGGQRLLLRA
jgi:hypothetical protein